MNAARRLSGALCALLLVELLSVVLTGGGSLLQPALSVGPLGFALRLLGFGVCLGLRFRLLADDALRLSRARLTLVLLLLPTLQQFQFAGGRLGGDGVMYYVYVRSLVKDLDLDFTNEYTHYGLIERGDLAIPTSTGRRRSIFAIGPGLLALPGFLLGEAAARIQAAIGSDADLSGYGPTHTNGVALGNLLYGFAALLLIHALLRRHFRETTALGATLLLWGTSFLHWYMVQQPVMSHAASSFAAALVLLLWDRWRGATGGWRALALGLLLGLAMCVRWQNGVLLLLPGIDLLRTLRGRPRAAVLPAAALALGTLAGAFPQLLAWRSLYGEYLLLDPPHGADFLRLGHPFLLETFFASRHGLLSWTPALWAGYLGFLPLLRRRRALAAPLLVPLLLMSYVNVCSGDWWAGGSFSNRRFDSLLPILALGLAAAIDALRGAIAARPGLALACCGVPFAVWNLALVEQTARGLVPRDDTVGFARLAGNAAQVFAERLGFPTTWPASWIFAARHELPPGRYDLAVGRYLFYRQNNLGGVIELGDPASAALLAEGWGRIQAFTDGARGREAEPRARLLAPLDVPEPLELRLLIRAMAAPAEAALRVNGRLAGRLGASDGDWREVRVAAPQALWRRELNEVVLETTAGRLAVSAVRFVRSPS